MGSLYVPLASGRRYNGYTHRYPIGTVAVIPSSPSGPSSLGVPTIGRTHYVNYKTYRGLYPTHPLDSVCIRNRRHRHMLWSSYLAFVCEGEVSRGGRVGQESFLGVINVDAIKTATTFCNYAPSGGGTNRDTGRIPINGVACHRFPPGRSGISLLNCNYVH